MRHLPFWIAQRYLFSKNNPNAINIITGISVLGLTIGSATLILLFTVFNGFEVVISSFYSYFDPPLKVTPIKGKHFELTKVQSEALIKIDGLTHCAQVLEELALLEYKKTNEIGMLKGVDTTFSKINKIEDQIVEGEFVLQERNRPYLVFGAGLARKLMINPGDQFEEVSVFMPNQNKGPFDQSFIKSFAKPAGVFQIQAEYDNTYVISSLDFAQNLLRTKKLSALEIAFDPNKEENSIREEVLKIMGENFEIKNRYQQKEAFFKVMNMEKWISFAIFSFTALLIAFNMIGALWMIVLEKRNDIRTFKSFGATDGFIQRIFLFEGLWIGTLGFLSGSILAIIIYILQKTVGIISVPENFIVDSYPMDMRIGDFLVVAIAIIVISFLAAFPASLKAKSITVTKI